MELENMLSDMDCMEFRDEVETRLKSLGAFSEPLTFGDYIGIIRGNKLERCLSYGSYGNARASIIDVLSLLYLDFEVLRLSDKEYRGICFSRIAQTEAELGNAIYRYSTEKCESREMQKLLHIYTRAIEDSYEAKPLNIARKFFYCSIGKAYLFRGLLRERNDADKIGDINQGISMIVHSIVLGCNQPKMYEFMYNGYMALCFMERDKGRKKELLQVSVDCLEYSERLMTKRPPAILVRKIIDGYAKLSQIEFSLAKADQPDSSFQKSRDYIDKGMFWVDFAERNNINIG